MGGGGEGTEEGEDGEGGEKKRQDEGKGREIGKHGEGGKKRKILRVRALRRCEKGRQRQGEGGEVRGWEGETYPIVHPLIIKIKVTAKIIYHVAF